MKKTIVVCMTVLLAGSAFTQEKRDAEFYMNRGAAYYRAGDPDAAVADYADAIRLNPDLVKSLNDYDILGRVVIAFAEADEWALTVPLLEWMRELFPHELWPPETLGSVYLKLTSPPYNTAFQYFLEAEKLNTENKLVYYNLACIYSLRGELDEAVKSMDKAVFFGYFDLEYLNTDPGLENFRTTSWWKSIADQREAIQTILQVFYDFWETWQEFSPQERIDRCNNTITQLNILAPAVPIFKAQPLAALFEAYTSDENLEAAIETVIEFFQVELSTNPAMIRDMISMHIPAGNSFEENISTGLLNSFQALLLDPNEDTSFLIRCLFYIQNGEYDRVIADCRQKIRINPDEASAYFIGAFILLLNEEYDEALENCAQLIRINPNEASYYSLRSLLHMAVGDFEKALEDIDESIRLDPGSITDFYALSLVNTSRGEYELALENITQAIKNSPEDLDFYLMRSRIYSRAGDYALALEDLNKAILLNPGSSGYYRDRGGIYTSMGELELALNDFNQAVRLDPENAAAYIDRGGIYERMEKPLNAMEDYNAGIEADPHSALAYVFRGRLYNHLGLHEPAAADFTRALEINPNDYSVYLFRSFFYYEAGDYEAALKDYNRLLVIAEASNDFNDVFAIAWTFAKPLEQMFDYSKPGAEAFFEEFYALTLRALSIAIGKAEQIRSSLGSRGKEIMAQQLYLYYAGVDMEVRYSFLNMDTPDFGSAEKAFEYSEALRSRGFLEQLGTEAALRLPGVTETEKRKFQELTNQIKNLQEFLNGYRGVYLAEDAAASYADAGQRLNVLEKELADLDMNIASRIPQYAGLRYPKPAAIETAKAFCGEDRAVLEYVLWDDSAGFHPIINTPNPVTINSYCLVLTKDGVIPVRLDPDFDYQFHINEVREAIKDEAPLEEFEESRNALYAALVAPVLPHIPENIKNILIVPDGPLTHLPFDVLRENDDEKGYLFGERYRISFSPSVSVSIAANGPARGAARPNEPLLAFGGAWYNPDKSAADRARSGRSGEADNAAPGASADDAEVYYREERWQDLPGTEAEVIELQKLAFSQIPLVFLGKDVSEARVKELSLNGTLAKYPVLHFACHGYFNGPNPSLSTVVFSEVSGLLEGATEDGYLTVPEIALLSLDARMVVLSACETGLGRLKRGDGMVGLTRSFLTAGADRVGVSLWAIDDAATTEFMIRVYRKVIEGGMDFGEAYYVVKEEFRFHPKWKHPRYWAAFTLYE